MRLAVLTSHPIQYYAPLFRELKKRIDVKVFYAHRASAADQARAGFGTEFEWDVDLLSGYPFEFLTNVSKKPSPSSFFGCDTPEIGKKLKTGKFDALLVFGWHLKSLLQGVLAAKRQGLPVLVRGDSQLCTPRSKAKTAAKALIYPRFLRLFDAALYVGQRSRAYYQYYKYPSSRLFFSPHCIDTEWFAARATMADRNSLRERFHILRDTTVLLFAGQLIQFKRPYDLISAARKCLDAGIRVEVMIAGAGELQNELRAFAFRSGVRLHALGFCNQSQMPAVYAAGDILVLPSTGEETWGLVANEALACGKPIIVSDACGCSPDLASDGITGRTFKTADIEDLFRCVRDFTISPPLPENISSLSNHYSLHSAVDGIEEAFTSQVSKHKCAH